jgi:hypothetical protein
MAVDAAGAPTSIGTLQRLGLARSGARQAAR